MLPSIQIFDRWISMYWLSAWVGIVVAFAFALLRARNGHFRTPGKHVFFSLLCATIGARVGGILFNVVGHVLLYSDTPNFWTWRNWNMLLRAGGVMYGGLIVGFFAVLIYVRINKLDFRDLTDILVPTIALFLVFGRTGCFLAGCCFGRPAAWGFTMRDGVSRIPVQLIEAALHLFIFSEMLRLRPERERPGVLLPAYLTIYTVGRFLIEFMRGDEIRGVFLLSTSQWISLLILSALFIAYLVTRRKKKMESIVEGAAAPQLDEIIL